MSNLCSKLLDFSSFATANQREREHAKEIVGSRLVKCGEWRTEGWKQVEAVRWKFITFCSPLSPAAVSDMKCMSASCPCIDHRLYYCLCYFAWQFPSLIWNHRLWTLWTLWTLETELWSLSGTLWTLRNESPGLWHFSLCFMLSYVMTLTPTRKTQSSSKIILVPTCHQQNMIEPLLEHFL